MRLIWLLLFFTLTLYSAPLQRDEEQRLQNTSSVAEAIKIITKGMPLHPTDKISLKSRHQHTHQILLKIRTKLPALSITLLKSMTSHPYIATYPQNPDQTSKITLQIPASPFTQDILVIIQAEDEKFYSKKKRIRSMEDIKRFDCSTLKNPREEKLCQEIKLENLKEALSNKYIYFQEQDYLPASRKLSMHEKDWEETLTVHCPKQQKQCLIRAYEKQIKLLEKTYSRPYKPYKKNTREEATAILSKLIKEQKIRKASDADLKAWAEAKLASEHKELPPTNQKNSYMSVYPFGMPTAYVVLEAIDIPYGLPRSVFFIPKGVPYPNSNPSHKKIYEFETLTCNGSGCAQRTHAYMKKKKKPIHNSCQSKKITLGPDTLLYVGGALRGRGLEYAIDRSGAKPGQFDLVVNAPNRDVALLLSARYPSLWKIKWSKGTHITHVFLTGVHKQVISGLPKEIPLSQSFKVDDPECYLDHVYLDTLEDINAFTQKIYSKKADKVFLGRQNGVFYGKVNMGEPISKQTPLLFSKETPPESFYIMELGLSGISGIEALLREKKIKKLDDTIIEKWANARYQEYLRETPERARTKEKKNFTLNFAYRPYMVVDKIRFPAGYRANYFLQKGVPYPKGKLPKGATLFDFNTLKCEGMDCRNYK